jgi:lysophospholipase L1-like esterase
MRPALLGVLAGLVVAAPAAAAPLALDARVGATGWIDFIVTGREGTTVHVAEDDGSPVADVGLGAGRATRRRATQWRCDRTLRRFVATAPEEDGATETATAEVRTPGCAERLAIATRPFAPKAGRKLLVRVRDHWRLGGFTVRVCLAGRCKSVRLPQGRVTRNVRIRTGAPGIRAVTATPPWRQRVRQTVEVRSRPLTLLATGDSMIQIVDTDLRRRLRPRGVRVQSDARIGTGISKPFMLDWVALARRQALARRPNVTVVFLGANDGFPIARQACCGPRWIEGYAARVKRMMASYRRNGAARVYWLTLPTPRKATFARVFRAVNAALHLAEPALRGGGGRILDMGRVFTPGGRFRSSIGGHVVRQDDGVHLNVRGASIAAGLVVRRLRRDGVLP